MAETKSSNRRHKSWQSISMPQYCYHLFLICHVISGSGRTWLSSTFYLLLLSVTFDPLQPLSFSRSKSLKRLLPVIPFLLLPSVNPASTKFSSFLFSLCYLKFQLFLIVNNNFLVVLILLKSFSSRVSFLVYNSWSIS